MSVRWMAVQYVGDMLRLPVVNEGDMDKPFGSSVLERDVKRIVVNPFSDNQQTFVPELENAKLRELVRDMFEEIEAGGFDPMVERHGKSTVYYEEDPSWRVGIRERMRELRIEMEDE